MNKPLRVFEAFSGVGSQRMALRNLGIFKKLLIQKKRRTPTTREMIAWLDELLGEDTA